MPRAEVAGLANQALEKVLESRSPPFTASTINDVMRSLAKDRSPSYIGPQSTDFEKFAAMMEWLQKEHGWVEVGKDQHNLMVTGSTLWDGKERKPERKRDKDRQGEDKDTRQRESDEPSERKDTRRRESDEPSERDEE